MIYPIYYPTSWEFRSSNYRSLSGDDIFEWFGDASCCTVSGHRLGVVEETFYQTAKKKKKKRDKQKKACKEILKTICSYPRVRKRIKMLSDRIVSHVVASRGRVIKTVNRFRSAWRLYAQCTRHGHWSAIICTAVGAAVGWSAPVLIQVHRNELVVTNRHSTDRMRSVRIWHWTQCAFKS